MLCKNEWQKWHWFIQNPQLPKHVRNTIISINLPLTQKVLDIFNSLFNSFHTKALVFNHIKGFNEARHILIQTFNSNPMNRSATLIIKSLWCNKKLIDNNQHCSNKKQYFLSLSLIIVRKKSFTPWCALTWQMRVSAARTKRRGALAPRGAAPTLNINYLQHYEHLLGDYRTFV